MLLNRVLFMRFVILGLSFTFLLLSAIVTFKALDQPVRNLADQATTQNDVLAGNVMPESSSAIQHTTENSESNQAQVAELEATIAKLEEKLTTTEAVIENIRTP
jgi:molecular chaperone GrpE (heat shock protein)